MDPFTQNMLQKAEQRSRALGINNPNKFSLASKECNFITKSDAVSAIASVSKKNQISSALTNTSSSQKLQVMEKKPTEVTTSENLDNTASSKVMRQFSAFDKENMDLGIEINIMTDKNVEVQVQVEHQDITTDDDNEHSPSGALQMPQTPNEFVNTPLAKIRDTSRNRLQRLGALYSDTNDLSSPIHRTEEQFHADSIGVTENDGNVKRITPRLGKLAALASSINQWEDDISHHNPQSSTNSQISTISPPKPDLPSNSLDKPVPPIGSTLQKEIVLKPPKTNRTQNCVSTAKSGKQTNDPTNAFSINTKSLNWDPKVIDSLEAQGFQRRESSTVKLAYDYYKEQDRNDIESEMAEENPLLTKPQIIGKPNVGKLPISKVFQKQTQSDESNSNRRVTSVRPGLVSGRTAVFENKAIFNQQQLQQQETVEKDPTELSLRERMQLFEKNKGEALLPKAALGIAPPISKIRQDNLKKQAETKALSNSSLGSNITSTVTSNVYGKVREKVAALVSNASGTISENIIKAEIEKQKQEDMKLLANRFATQKEISKVSQNEQHEKNYMAAAKPSLQETLKHKERPTPTPPPPPPPPSSKVIPPQVGNVYTSKKRSPGDTFDDDSKRARKSNSATATISRSSTVRNRLYPVLSDLESANSQSSENIDPTASVQGISDDEQRIRNHPGCTMDNDNDSYMDSDQADDSCHDVYNGSLGREIMQEVQSKNEQQQQKKEWQSQLKKEVHYAEKNDYIDDETADSSMNSSDISTGVDDYLDEALEEQRDGDDDCTQESDDNDDYMNNSRASSGSKGTTASNSFSFRKMPSNKFSTCQTINESKITEIANRSNINSPVKSELTVNKDDGNMVTLVHTVSFYRRQQNSNSEHSTPVRKICREEQVHRSDLVGTLNEKMGFNTSSSVSFNSEATPYKTDSANAINNENYDLTSETDEDESQYKVQEKVKKLLDEVRKQQTVIAQTSQALNLCAATVEFSGSTESVEGERHLLVATHRRQACLDEIHRLRVEQSVRPNGAPRERGVLTVKEITLPLQQNYIRKLAADTISGHHLVCLLKYNEHVLATKTVPTLPGLLAVKFPDVLQLNNVYADFKITLEIYGMTAQREVLPHDVKYHINLNKKSGIKTPKKKGSENILIMPPVQSPAGPQVVRTPALVQYGFAIFSLREIQRISWTLTQLLGVSPLEGVVQMKVNCELSVSVEHRGFLTMFEDITGFGAWHRRWCHLNGTLINYWKYPDDEKKKTPMGSIDLYTCVSQRASLAPRDVCARLNTILLECERPAKETDEESLVIIPNGKKTIIRHLLSADTKEEREEWCAYFNKALTLLRAWGPPQ